MRKYKSMVRNHRKKWKLLLDMYSQTSGVQKKDDYNKTKTKRS